MFKIPQMTYLPTNITNAQFDKAKAASFNDTMIIMKPLGANMVAACLQRVIGIGNKNKKPKTTQSRLITHT